MNFFFEFLKNPAEVGAITPSSDELAELMTSSPLLKKATVIAELGSGTGAFTKKILLKTSPKCRFFVLESNLYFHKILQANFPSLTIYNDSAENLPFILQNKINTPHCDLIISGLPWTTFEQNLQERTLTAIANSLRDGGEFLTFAYMHGLFLPSARRFQKLLNTHFKKVRPTPVVWANVPPALVYVCEK